MRTLPLVALAIVVIASLTEMALAGEKGYAPLPDKIIAAKRVYFLNESGTARFGDDLYRQLKKWNHWEVVGDKEKADLILVLSPSDTAPVVITAASATVAGQSAYGSQVTTAGNMQTQHWHLYVIDAKTGETLWRSDASMGGKLWRSWGSIAKSLLSDIQKRFNRQTD